MWTRYKVIIVWLVVGVLLIGGAVVSYRLWACGRCAPKEEPKEEEPKLEQPTSPEELLKEADELLKKADKKPTAYVAPLIVHSYKLVKAAQGQLHQYEELLKKAKEREEQPDFTKIEEFNRLAYLLIKKALELMERGSPEIAEIQKE